MKPESEASVFRWETLREIGPDVLPFLEPVPGFVMEVELISEAEFMYFVQRMGGFIFVMA
jgi:hypothetical protein